MIPNNASEAIEKLKNIDRFDPWHIESNEFTEDDHIAIQEVIEWLQGKPEEATEYDLVTEVISRLQYLEPVTDDSAEYDGQHTVDLAIKYLGRYAELLKAFKMIDETSDIRCDMPLKDYKKTCCTCRKYYEWLTAGL